MHICYLVVLNVMPYVKKSVTLTPELLAAADAVARSKGRTLSQQIRESLQNDPDVYEKMEEMKNE